MQRQGVSIRPFFLTTVVIAITIAAAMMSGEGRNNSTVTAQKTEDQSSKEKNWMPLAVYQAAESADPMTRAIRRARSSRYDGRADQPIADLAPEIKGRVVRAHWWRNMPALPAEQSDAIVIGTIVDARAYLSNDKTGVYSEFTISVEDILKNHTAAPLNKNDSVFAEREGGAVELPSGRVLQIRVARQSMPLLDGRYVLFLKYSEEGKDYLILTGYRLRKGRVFALDGLDSKGKSGLQFATHDRAEEGTFLDTLRKTIAESSESSSRRGGLIQ